MNIFNNHTYNLVLLIELSCSAQRLIFFHKYLLCCCTNKYQHTHFSWYLEDKNIKVHSIYNIIAEDNLQIIQIWSKCKLNTKYRNTEIRKAQYQLKKVQVNFYILPNYNYLLIARSWYYNAFSWFASFFLLFCFMLEISISWNKESWNSLALIVI